jgi:hypothetical protein
VFSPCLGSKVDVTLSDSITWSHLHQRTIEKLESLEALQTIGFLFTAYTIRKDEKARKITNLIAINSQHREIWKDFYQRPKLGRAIDRGRFGKTPTHGGKSLFVNLLILR